MKRKSARTITLFALVAALAVGAAALPHEPGSAARHDSPYDLSFIDMMMMHHRQGLEMARLAEDRGQLPELKEFAQRVIADQEKDNSELQGLRDRFYAGEPKADKMRMGGMTMTVAEMQRTSEADMRKLQAATGGAFDRPVPRHPHETPPDGHQHVARRREAGRARGGQRVRPHDHRQTDEGHRGDGSDEAEGGRGAKGDESPPLTG
ncbi:MAG TPA: DUF305 domain-containing protein [Pyrinomonadaceae bacterium]|nr:DUF305 domain-containing protein [Pyrinomonadaceae bacterium]